MSPKSSSVPLALLAPGVWLATAPAALAYTSKHSAPMTNEQLLGGIAVVAYVFGFFWLKHKLYVALGWLPPAASPWTGKDPIDFDAAVAAYRFAALRLSSGHLDQQGFDAEAASLTGKDAEGKAWRIEPSSGDWQVAEGQGWTVAAPPGQCSSNADRYNYVRAASADQTPTILQFFGIPALGALLLGVPEAAGSLALAGALSFYLARRERTDSWDGQVVQIVEERDRRGQAASGRYVHVALERGGFRKLKAMPGWALGDLLTKADGEPAPRRVGPGPSATPAQPDQARRDGGGRFVKGA